MGRIFSLYIPRLECTSFLIPYPDSDLWMYVLFVNGEQVDQFNPIPDYWQDNVPDEEIRSWRGDAAIISKHVPSIKKEEIENYLVPWELDAEEPPQAYPDDEYSQEEYQLFDFMRKLGLPNPVDEDGRPKGVLYKLWTNQLALNSSNSKGEEAFPNKKNNESPWWKFW